MSTFSCIFLQTENVIATCIMQHNTETHSTLHNVKWNIQTKDMTKFYYCNELGEINAGWIPARPASVDQVHTKE